MESLEKQLICPICLELFTKPVVILPCQHNLCRKCANDVFQASNPYLSTRSGSTVTTGGRFRCPSCRHEVVLDRHGVYGLQRNLLVENIIDMYKQGSTSSRPVQEEKQDQPMCETHEEEKINIYCVTCSIPTCSLCKVFGVHRDCEVAPLDNIFHKQKAELTDCISLLVGNNERNQAIINQLEATCSAVNENGRRQKSKVCEAFDHLFALLEERKGEMTLKISCEQQEKVDYIRGLSRKYSEHLESTAKLLETAIQTMDESEMAVFLQTAKPLLQKMVEGADTSHMDKIQRGYDNMEHFTASFERQRRALMSVDFIKLDEDDDDEEEEVREVRGKVTANQQSANQQSPQRPSEATATVMSSTTSPIPKASSQTTPPHRPSEAPPPHKPSEALAPQRPSEATSPHRPSEAPPPHRPSEALSLHRPSEAPPPQRPSEAPAPRRPSEGPPSQSPSEAPAPRRPSEGPPSQSPSEGPAPQSPSEGLSTLVPLAKCPAPSSSNQTPPLPPRPTTNPATQVQSDQQNQSEDNDGPKHVFSFSWLNQK